MDFQDVKSAVWFTDVGPLLPSAGRLVEEQHVVCNYLLQLLFIIYLFWVFIIHTWANNTLLTADWLITDILVLTCTVYCIQQSNNVLQAALFYRIKA